MDPALARWLVSDAAIPALVVGHSEADPDSLAAATRLRRLVDPDQAAVVLTQIGLRRRAVAKFGDRAEHLFFTPDGLEQATRAPVARRRAERFATRSRRVADLGCGIGADALALLDAGVEVVAVEADAATAVLAEANLATAGGCSQVIQQDAVTAWAGLRGSVDGVFCDPARRTGAGRSWRIDGLSPPWDFALSLLEESSTACLKLGPGIDRGLLPSTAEVEWVSDAGTVVECALWAGNVVMAGRRRAVVDGHTMTASSRSAVAITPPGAYLWEPDGAIIRAGAVDDLAQLLDASRIDSQVAYLTSDAVTPSPFARAFVLTEILPWNEKLLRAWVRDQEIGVLTIKKRGIDVDPAALRRRLKPRGVRAATVILAPTPAGALAMLGQPVAAAH
ncbi:MAG: THUMP-like domain-containing protein [Propioniciclava sp.]